MRSSKSRTIDSKRTSKSPSKTHQSPKLDSEKNHIQKVNSSKVLMKNSSSKQILLKPSTPKAMSKQYASNVELRTPLIKSLKPSDTQSYLKKIDNCKELMIQKPKIIKKKNETVGYLQNKLRSLEDKITSLKTNISSTDLHIERMKKSRTKSKESKKSSVSASAKKRTLQSVDKSSSKQQSKFQPKSMVRSPSKGLNSYVTKWKPTELNQTPTESAKETITSKYYIKHKSNIMREHLLQSITIFNYMKKIIKPEDSEIESIKVRIPGKALNKKTLVFDLDQTLIHCVEMGQASDIKLPITFPNGDVVSAGINIRAHAREILTNLSNKFQIVVFTASHSCYANVILDWIDPKRQIVHHRYYRENCYKTPEGMYIKDLRIFSNRDLENVVLIDNAPYSYFFQLENGVPILPFYNSKEDVQLKSLEKFLINEVYPASNVKTVLKNYFKLNKYKEYEEPGTLMEHLYSN